MVGYKTEQRKIMKVLKGILITILIIILAWNGLWHLYLKNIGVNEEKTVQPTVIDDKVAGPTLELNTDNIETPSLEVEESQEVTIVKLDPLQEALKLSDRVNIVVFAHDGSRADTIMMVSYDPTNQFVDVINIPRDTFWQVEGYTFDIGNQKINAVYGRGDGLGGSVAMKQAIADLLRVPVTYFIKLNYKGAAEIVDALGGIELEVKRTMDYDDTYADPPLHIDIPSGWQTLNGDKAVEYLRWRQNNDGYKEGDLPRIKRMQEFMGLAINKALSLKLPSFIKACFNNIYTDIELTYGTSIALKAIGMPGEHITFHRLPGTVEGYYYHIDSPATASLLLDIYLRHD